MKYTQFIICLSVLCSTLLLRGQVIYDNIGNGGPFLANSGFTVGTSQLSEVAVKFTAGSTLFLDYAELALIGARSGNPNLSVALLSDAGGSPGTVVESSTLTMSPFGGFGFRPLSHVEFSNTTLLTAGSIYWLAVSPSDVTTDTAWDNLSTPLGIVAIDDAQIGFGDPWFLPSLARNEGGMRIFGATAVPEPSTYSFLGVTVLLGIVVFRHRGSARSQSGSIRGRSDGVGPLHVAERCEKRSAEL